MALDHFGRVDVLIDNAGILRHKSLTKMEPADFESVVAVQLSGDDASVDGVAAYWERIADISGARPFDSAGAALMRAFASR